ncbi:MAG: hypothetical protein BLM47_11015 [Candidatus Reconcilbacillus cellulovorans]|uniref:GGDEF domain-containing protein n=1 Tax=Candidatus Reconcilbacillus cellulovorans TaxID=1906605 RepID=A0A2A6DY70_9BACL|nr:MAG: hypothetical protein BLM47_11015 [Candidatus Reconcilbacillus cellulovorans]
MTRIDAEFVERMPDPAFVVVNDKVVYENERFRRQFGAGFEPAARIAPGQVEEWMKWLKDADLRSSDSSRTYRFRLADGGWSEADVSIVPVEWEGCAARLALFREQRRRTPDVEHRLLESAGIGVWVLDTVRNAVVFVSPAFYRLTGMEVPEFWEKLCKSPETAAHPDDAAKIRRMVRELKEGRSVEARFRLRREDPDRYVHLEIRTTPVVGPDGRLERLEGVLSDITERAELEQRLHYMANHDELTGLLNLRALRRNLRDAVARAKRAGKRVAVVCFDIDHFKKINDRFGSFLADQLLCETADRLRTSAGPNRWVARFSADEFAVVVADVVSRDDIRREVERLLRLLREPYNLDGYDLYVSFSAGIAVYPDDTDEESELLNVADTALLHAKRNRNTYVFYQKALSPSTLEGAMLEIDLRKALERDQFELYYQPQFDLNTRKIVGAEALIRWNHPTLGQIMPSKFIPLAEETGAIEQIGEWVIRRVCRNIKKWQDLRDHPIPISVNLSARQFREENLVDKIADALNETEADPRLLELEITETMSMNDQCDSVLRDLKKLGVRISIDDFGKGYSSMAYLNRFPINRLKIDRSFVADMEQSEENYAIVSTITALGHHLHLEVVAEGVENAQQCKLLKTLSCDVAQGFYFSPPLPEKRFERVLLKA